MRALQNTSCMMSSAISLFLHIAYKYLYISCPYLWYSSSSSSFSKPSPPLSVNVYLPFLYITSSINITSGSCKLLHFLLKKLFSLHFSRSFTIAEKNTARSYHNWYCRTADVCFILLYTLNRYPTPQMVSIY